MVKMGVEYPWILGELNSMDSGLVSLCGFHESVEAMKQKLLQTTIELNALRANAKEEIQKSEENINQLHQLLNLVTYERDEARQQVQFLLSKIKQQQQQIMLEHSEKTQNQPRDTEIDNLSSTHRNHKSYVSSPVEHLLVDNANSPELSSVNNNSSSNIANNSYYLITSEQEEHKFVSPANNVIIKHDRGDTIIDHLAMSKCLPERGKLMQAVLDAGPLLQTSLLAGPLPQWRNPPPLQTMKVPALDRNANLLI